MKNILLLFILFTSLVSWGQRVNIDELTLSNETYSFNGKPYDGSVYVLYDSGQLKEEFGVKKGILDGEYILFQLDKYFKKINFKDTLEIHSLLSHIDTTHIFISNQKKDSIRENRISDDIKFVELGVKKFYKYKERYREGKLKKEKLYLYQRYLQSIKKLENSIQRLKESYTILDSLEWKLKEEKDKSIYRNQLKEKYTYIRGNQTGIHMIYDDYESLELEEELKDGVRNGSYKSYENGKIREEGTYLNNKKNGLWTFYINNEPHEYINFKDDIKSGLYKKYNKWGDNVILVGIYENNLKEGIWKTNNQYGELMTISQYKNDTLHGLFQRFTTDTVTQEGYYQNGFKVGGWKEYSVSGELLSTSFYSMDTLNGGFKKYNGDVIVEEGTYLKGLMTGEWIFRWDNGNLKGKGKYIDGDGGNVGSSEIPKNGRNGEWIFYHENGNKKTEGKFLKGEPEGEFTWYYPIGKKKQVVTFKNGEMEGELIIFHENGNKKEIRYYKNGQTDYDGNILKTFDINGDLTFMGVYYEIYGEYVQKEKIVESAKNKNIQETVDEIEEIKERLRQKLDSPHCNGKILDKYLKYGHHTIKVAVICPHCGDWFDVREYNDDQRNMYDDKEFYECDKCKGYFHLRYSHVRSHSKGEEF